jgi:alpha,alpha-trehalose phosphorylase
MMDLDDLESNTRDGLHIASLAGAWQALVAGFGGLRDYAGRLTFRPHLPEGLDRLAFTISRRGQRLRVEVRPREATYLLTNGVGLELTHHGERVTLTPGEPLTRRLPPIPRLPRPAQPPGRAPKMRRGRPLAD